MTTLGSKGRTILVAGRGEAATAVVNALSGLSGVGTVRQIGQFDHSRVNSQLAGAHLLVDMVGGVAPAFAVAMAAMGQGVGCITTNPLLVATHGRVLQNAAMGQHTYFGFQAAGFGLPVGELMAALRPTKVTASFMTAASVALSRMAFRNESLAHVSAHLKMMQMDLSDWGGKVTQARAMALRSLWFADELRGAQLSRTSVESVEPADIRRLREFGLQPVFGAEITEDGIVTGPLAVSSGSALLSANNQEVLVAETAQGEMVLTSNADDTARMVAGVVADVRQFLRSPKPMASADVRHYGMVEATTPVRAYVRLPYADREVVLGAKPEIMQERVDGDGLWQAVVMVERLGDIKVGSVGGMVFPIAGGWDAPVAGGLRLVG